MNSGHIMPGPGGRPCHISVTLFHYHKEQQVQSSSNPLGSIPGYRPGLFLPYTESITFLRISATNGFRSDAPRKGLVPKEPWMDTLSALLNSAQAGFSNVVEGIITLR